YESRFAKLMARKASTRHAGSLVLTAPSHMCAAHSRSVPISMVKMRAGSWSMDTCTTPGYEDDMIFLLHHTRPALWIRLPETRVRMEFMVMDDDDPEEIVTPEAIERISHGVLPASKFDPERQAIYMFRGRIAKSWRQGNVFLAGDAAHLAPPCFGQGLCAGLRDIANLAWKLDLVKRGQADDSILDTYESERKPHAQFWVEQAVTAAGFLQTTDAEAAAQRDANIRTNPMAAAPVAPP